MSYSPSGRQHSGDFDCHTALVQLAGVFSLPKVFESLSFFPVSTEAEKRGGRQSLRPGPGPSHPRICTILGKTGSFPPFCSHFSIKKQLPIISRAVIFSPLFSEKQPCHRRQVTGHLWSTIKSQLAPTRVYGRWKWAG